MNDIFSPAVLAMNIIRFIGDSVKRSGEPIRQLSAIAPSIGAPSEVLASELVNELENRGLVRLGNVLTTLDGRSTFLNVNLTLEGWERYESEKRGQFSGNCGFLAMKFGEADLEALVKEVVKPAIQKMGYDLVDLRDVARAGVIDNIMRAQIRDAAFVIVDLTHDNSGAYWEAGYAEGLGKPVIYMCEKTKFKNASTHFDTNHSTTVPWSRDNDEGFRKELIATLRRSLETEDGVAQRTGI